MKKVAYLSIFASLLGANVISVDLGLFQLSLFRMLIILMGILSFLKILVDDNKIVLFRNNENKYSTQFMLIWFIYAVFTVTWVRDYGSWLKSIYFLGIGIICVMLFKKEFKTIDDILTALRVMSVIMIIHNIIGWYEIYTGNYLFLHNNQDFYLIYRYPVSIFDNTNNFATFILLSIYINFICANTSKSIIAKLIYIGATISSFLLLIKTESRANLLGFILSLILFIFLSIQNKKERYTIMVVIIFVFGLILFKPEIITNLQVAFKQNLSFDFYSSNSSDIIRVNLIRNGFVFLLNTFGFGTGAGNIEYFMTHYSIYNTYHITDMHNWWMEILTGYGIIIFILYLIFYVKMFIDFYKKYKVSPDQKTVTILIGLMCFMTAFILGSTSSSSNISSEWLWVFWGIAVSLQGISLNRNNVYKNEQGVWKVSI